MRSSCYQKLRFNFAKSASNEHRTIDISARKKKSPESPSESCDRLVA